MKPITLVIALLLPRLITAALPPRKLLLRTIALFLLLVARAACIAQTTNTGDYNAFNIIPPAPSAMQMQKYGDYPVSHFTGVPQISIPLYTIKEGDIDFPITLDYHASGIKVNEHSGNIGLGWTLNVGGYINIRQNDLDDRASYFKLPVLQSPDGIMPYWRLDGQRALHDMAENYDNEYDVFSYDFLGHFGRFIIKDSPTHVAMLYPYKPYKIRWPTYGTAQGALQNFSSFDIYDEKGTQYRFGSAINGGGYASSCMIWGPEDGYACSMHLTDIVSGACPANKVNIAYFNDLAGNNPRYTTTRHQRDRFIWDDDFEADLPASCVGQGDQTAYHLQFSPFNIGGYAYDLFQTADEPIEPTPQLITFSRGYIKFIKGTVNNMISRMEVYNLNNQLIQAVNFTIAPFPTSKVGNAIRFYRLGGLQYLNSAGQVVNSYAFNYFYENQPDAMPGLETNAIDFWGYYNGNDVNPSLVPRWNSWTRNIPPSQGFTSSVGNADRSANEYFLKTYTLNKITYPTGGHTDFDYEINKTTGLVFNGSGLRVKKITNYTAEGQQADAKTYDYPGSYMPVVPDMSLYYYNREGILLYGRCSDIHCTIVLDSWEPFRRTTFTTEASVDLAPKGSAVVNTNVSEDLGDGRFNSYAYDFEPEQYGTYLVDNSYYEATQNAPYLLCDKPWNSGNLLSRDNGITTENYEYEEIIHDAARDIKLYRFRFPYYSPFCPFTQSAVDGFDYGNDLNFNFGDHYYYSGEKRLKRKTVTVSGQETLPNGAHPAVESVIDYTYSNNFHDLPTTIATANSKNETVQDQNSYPSEMASAGTPNVYNEMVDKNILNPIIKKVSTNNGVFVSSHQVNYKDWGNGVIKPETIVEKNGTGTEDVKIRYSAYDEKGNVITLSKEDDIKISYVWDYGKTYPVAEIKNAPDYNDIAYTSFESDGTGSWSFNTNGIVAGTAPTGNKYYQLSGSNTLSRAGMNTAQNYIVSYWSSNGSPYAVSGASSFIQGNTWNGWTYFEHQVTGASAITITGAGNIDELRLYPKDAQMDTYTYLPLVGMTSQCDKNNKITYYEFDNVGRLAVMRDGNRNIIKKFCYKFYSDALSPCAITNGFANAALSVVFYKVGCGAGYFSKPVNYPVPAGKYFSTVSQADADTQAQADANANGQVYANANGQCQLLYYNQQQSGNYTRNNCPASYPGSVVTYTVPANTYSSVVGVPDANTQALADVSANGQNYANQHGTCPVVYFNDYQQQQLARNNCGPGYHGTRQIYGVLPGTYHSIISTADANNQALADVAANAQNYVNNNAFCVPNQVYAKLVYENIYYGDGYTTGDVVVYFYADAACTIPVQTGDIVLRYKSTDECTNNTDIEPYDTWGGYNYSYVLQSGVYLMYTGYDVNTGYTDTYCNVDFELLTNPGYIIAN